MKSVLYIWLPCKPIYPIGATYLALAVHQAHPEVRQRILDLSQISRRDRMPAIREAIRSHQPDLIAFSWRDIQIYAPHEGDVHLKYAFDFYYAKSLIRKGTAAVRLLAALLTYEREIADHLATIRRVCRDFLDRPHRHVMVGGGAFSAFSEQIMRRLPEGVIGVAGEGEDALLKLIAGRSLTDERVIIRRGDHVSTGVKPSPTQIEDFTVDLAYLETIFPQHAAYHDTSIGVQTKRGCPYDCAFCIYPYIEGKRVRSRPPAHVVADIMSHHQRWGSRRFWFTDAQFIPGAYAIPACSEILERLIATGVDLEWSGYIRTSLITPDLARIMVKSGLGDLEVAITSGSQRIVDELTLGFQLEDLYQGCRYLKEAGFRGRLILNYSLNAPGDTEETLLESVASYKEIARIMGEDRVFPFIFFLGVQPHTGLEARLLNEGYLAPGYDPLSLNPFTVRKMLYNPAPLNRVLAQACLEAWEGRWRAWHTAPATSSLYANETMFQGIASDTGRDVLMNVERLLRERAQRPRAADFVSRASRA